MPVADGQAAAPADIGVEIQSELRVAGPGR